MARTLEELEKELLALQRDERVRLAHELLLSLDEEEARLSPGEWEAAWAEETQSRERDLREGRTKSLPADDVIRELKEKATK